MLRKLFLSHAVVQVCGGNPEPSLLFPQMEHITHNDRHSQHLSYPQQTGEHVSHISHPLPGRSSMSITRTYRRPGQSQHNSGIWYKLPNQTSSSTSLIPSQTSSPYHIPSQTSSPYHIPSQTSSTYNMPTITGSNQNMQMLSGSSFNIATSYKTPFQPKHSVNKSHFISYMNTYTNFR